MTDTEVARWAAECVMKWKAHPGWDGYYAKPLKDGRGAVMYAGPCKATGPDVEGGRN